MPKRPSRDVVGKYVELRPELAKQMDELAASNSRTFRDELEHAIERHLAKPPTIRVEINTPELAPAEISPAPSPPSRRTRARKPTTPTDTEPETAQREDAPAPESEPDGANQRKTRGKKKS